MVHVNWFRRIIGVAWLICILSSNAYAAEKIAVVSTTGQITNVVEIVGGDRVSVQGLMGPGVDPHLYKASEGDVTKLASADIIFYNGLFLEAKMENIFKRMNRTKKTVPVGESVPPDQLLESQQYEGHYDPHIWFDVRLWMKVTERIRDALSEFDPEHKDEYHQRASDYIIKQQELHLYVQSRASEIPFEKRILVTAHDAFRYFGKAYGFEVIGLQGISTQSEAGAADVRELADFIVDRRVKAVFIESSVPVRNIQAVQQAVQARGWDVKIGGELFSDAMGDEDTFEGTYIGMVTHNIDTIINAIK